MYNVLLVQAEKEQAAICAMCDADKRARGEYPYAISAHLSVFAVRRWYEREVMPYEAIVYLV